MIITMKPFCFLKWPNYFQKMYVSNTNKTKRQLTNNRIKQQSVNLVQKLWTKHQPHKAAADSDDVCANPGPCPCQTSTSGPADGWRQKKGWLDGRNDWWRRCWVMDGKGQKCEGNGECTRFSMCVSFPNCAVDICVCVWWRMSHPCLTLAVPSSPLHCRVLFSDKSLKNDVERRQSFQLGSVFHEGGEVGQTRSVSYFSAFPLYTYALEQKWYKMLSKCSLPPIDCI